jgi:hypothetical protein
MGVRIRDWSRRPLAIVIAGGPISDLAMSIFPLPTL